MFMLLLALLRCRFCSLLFKLCLLSSALLSILWLRRPDVETAGAAALCGFLGIADSAQAIAVVANVGLTWFCLRCSTQGEGRWVLDPWLQ